MQSTQGLLISADDGAVDLCVVYMRATYSKYILHKASKPATYIWVRLIIGCVQYTLKYSNLFVQRLINMIYLQADSFSELFSKSIQCISKISLMLCLYNANLGAMLVFTLQQNSVKNESQLRD